LDRETSGVLVFARRREANAGLATQFEGRSVRKTYVACVTGWPGDAARATLRDVLVPDRGGRGRGAARRAKHATGAQAAVTHVRVLGRRGDRAMLELGLETGRTHQARVQLAHAGAAIAGDPLYGEPASAAPRLMLHARAVDLQHPATRKALRLE